MFRILLVALVLFTVGCATSNDGRPQANPAEPVDKSGRYGFMGLDDAPLQADWEGWTPTESRATPSVDGFIAFDMWTLTEPAQKEQLWASVFSLLDASRGYLPDEAGPTVRELMTLLDPGANPGMVRTDVVFIVGANGEDEGILFRTYREMPNGGTPGVVLELRRAAGAPDEPGQIELHLHSGYEEAPSFRVDFGQQDEVRWAPAEAGASWNSIRNEGLARELAVMRDIVSATFWLPSIRTAYVEPIWDVERGEGGASPDFPVGHGAEVELRPIEAVLSDTVFPPRLDL